MRFAIAPNHSKSFWTSLSIFVAGVLISGGVQAQYGVSPSQTGAFFDDLRGRAGAKFNQATVQTGEGVYDFSNGTYEGTASDSSGSVFQDASRQINSSYSGAGNVIYSQRQAGDYTQYSGPYPSSGTFFAPAYTSDALLGGKRNLKVGPVNLGFGLTTIYEYNDNLNRSGVDPIADSIASAYLNISANYQVTETSALTLSTALGFDHYFDHPELSPYGGDFVLNVLPGSTIAFDGKIGPVYLVLYDRVSVRPAVQNNYTLDNRNVFGVFQNDIGLGANWAINSKLNLSTNYVHSDALALEDADKIYERTTDAVSASLAWSPTGTWTAGLEATHTWLSYPENYNNGGTLSNAGAFFAMPIGRSTSIRIAGGVQEFQFDDPDASTINKTGDTSDLSDYYYNVTVSNRLSSRVSHALNFGHESALNTDSNFITADYISYGVGIIAWSGSRVSISGYYESAEDSGGVNAEDINQWGLDAYLSHQITQTVRAGIGYHYGIAESDLANRDYTQHAFSLDLNWALSRKLSMTVGYRFFTTDADDDLVDFDQNRVILSANYNF